AEGIDLQFSANQLINYELTWNPNRLEQRNGRIDRFGQPNDTVFIRLLIMKDTLEMEILELIVNKAQEIKNAYGFVPGFFGDPEAVIDHIMKKRKEKKQVQQTLDLYFNFSSTVMEDLISIFFSKEKLEEMVSDSFYGHVNIDLKEIENRMRLTEATIGDSKTLFEFLKKAVQLYQGEIKPSSENEEIFEITLPTAIQQDIKVEFEGKYLITPNMEISAGRDDVEGISLKNALIAGLVEKIKNEAFSVENQFYGRTAAFLSEVASKVSVIFFIKIRYLVNTKEKSLMEEITRVGLDLFSGEVLDEADIEKIWNADMQNHGKPDSHVKKHLNKALEISNLEELFRQKSQERLSELIQKRNQMIDDLKKQGITNDLEGINDIDVVGIDLLTVTIIYPPVGGQ
ncbi:MAG: hypothetical protein ACTSQI_17150, partial [Candidatus Helarchaeota archaeon]